MHKTFTVWEEMGWKQHPADAYIDVRYGTDPPPGSRYIVLLHDIPALSTHDAFELKVTLLSLRRSLLTLLGYGRL